MNNLAKIKTKMVQFTVGEGAHENVYLRMNYPPLDPKFWSKFIVIVKLYTDAYTDGYTAVAFGNGWSPIFL